MTDIHIAWRPDLGETSGGPRPPEPDAGQVPVAAQRTLDDMGNAERLRDLFVQHVRHLGDDDHWVIWDGRRWALDQSRLSQEVAKAVVASMCGEQVNVLRELDGEAPDFPTDYPKVAKGGAPVSPDAWLDSDPAAAVAWLYETEERAAWLRRWMTWAALSERAGELVKFARLCRNIARLKSMLDVARSLPEITALRSDFDGKQAGVLNVLNGTIDVRTGLLREHRPADMNTRMCPINFDPAAPAPKWRRFLEQNLPDKTLREYVQKLIGYSLTGESDQKVIVFLFSKIGDTGKSLLLNVVAAMFGPDYAISLAQSAFAPRKEGGDGGRDPDREDIRGKRFVVASEFKPNEPMDEAFVKRLTGGDSVTTRGNYAKGNRTWEPELLPIIATNHLSRINAEDEAIWNRIMVVPFEVAFPRGHPERDENLKDDIIRDELPGVLAWAVEGLRMYRREGLAPPVKVVEASLMYRSDSDIIAKWIAAASDEGLILVKEGPGATVTVLFQCFMEWAKHERLANPPGRTTFRKQLTEAGYEYKAAGGSGENRNIRVIHGLHATVQVGSFGWNR